mmetsp:Transcript_36477/g.88666  ORF Transcript_36477/g.88666 Transcript_36477/m.88666 type:complete len:371 (-) Transcript_36477:7905-9017(-)
MCGLSERQDTGRCGESDVENLDALWNQVPVDVACVHQQCLGGAGDRGGGDARGAAPVGDDSTGEDLELLKVARGDLGAAEEHLHVIGAADGGLVRQDVGAVLIVLQGSFEGRLRVALHERGSEVVWAVDLVVHLQVAKRILGLDGEGDALAHDPQQVGRRHGAVLRARLHGPHVHGEGGPQDLRVTQPHRQDVGRGPAWGVPSGVSPVAIVNDRDVDCDWDVVEGTLHGCCDLSPPLEAVDAVGHAHLDGEGGLLAHPAPNDSGSRGHAPPRLRHAVVGAPLVLVIHPVCNRRGAQHVDASDAEDVGANLGRPIRHQVGAVQIVRDCWRDCHVGHGVTTLEVGGGQDKHLEEGPARCELVAVDVARDDLK